MPESTLTPREMDLGELILQAPGALWERLRKRLKVGSREEAARLAETDEGVRQEILGLLSPESRTLVTGAAEEAGGSLVTGGPGVKRRGGAKKFIPFL